MKQLFFIAVFAIALMGCETVTRYGLGAVDVDVDEVLCEHGLKNGECKNDKGKGNDITVDTIHDTVYVTNTVFVVDTIYCRGNDCDD